MSVQKTGKPLQTLKAKVPVPRKKKASTAFSDTETPVIQPISETGSPLVPKLEDSHPKALNFLSFIEAICHKGVLAVIGLLMTVIAMLLGIIVYQIVPIATKIDSLKEKVLESNRRSETLVDEYRRSTDRVVDKLDKIKDNIEQLEQKSQDTKKPGHR